MMKQQLHKSSEKFIWRPIASNRDHTDTKSHIGDEGYVENKSYAGNTTRHFAIKVLLSLGAIAAVLLIAWWRVLSPRHSGLSPFSFQAWSELWDFLDKLAGTENPAYQEISNWTTVFAEMLDTFELSLAGGILAGIGSLILTPFAIQRNPLWLRTPIKIFFVVARSIPEVIWALLFLFIWGPGIWGVALAIAVHNFGVLGRLFSGHLDANSPAPGERLEALYPNKVQRFLYGELSLFAPQLLTLWLNRWEIIIRSTVVLGFISSAGLGLHLRLALSGRRFSEVALVLMAYFALVLIVDFIAAGFRRLAR